MSPPPESLIVAKLMTAANAVALGASEALELIGTVPTDTAAFTSLGLIQRTAARALLKAVEQQQDVIARLFRTVLLAEMYDVAGMTSRDIANAMEKLGALDDAYAWSDLARLRNRLAHEYPVGVSAQLDRVQEAAQAVPALRLVLSQLTVFLADKGYLP